MNPTMYGWQRKALSFLVPTTKIDKPIWLETWQNSEKRRFRQISRLFFISSAIAYILHFFLIDLPIGKQPIELWASYRFGLAGLASLGFLLSFSNRFCNSHYYKLPVAVAGIVFSYLQVRTMLWSPGIPYFYAFLIPCLTSVILRFNLVASVCYLLFIHSIQIPSFLESGIEVHLLLSALTVSFMTVIVFRANMLTDINAFMSEQEKDEIKDQLNLALQDTKRKEAVLAKTNHQLLRKTTIFKTLLESSSNLSHFQEVRALLQYATKEFESLFPGCGFLLVLADSEGKRLEEAESINVDDGLRTEMVNNYQKLLNDDYKMYLQSLIMKRSRKSKRYPKDKIDSLPMISAADKFSGTAVIIGVGVDEDLESRETIDLLLALITGCAENLALTKKLEYLAHTDNLTSTFNRNFFERELRRNIRTNHKYPQLHFSLILIDVNGLKQVNDCYGHKEGDNLIVKVAGVLRSTCRKTDIVCRLGGDEFVILCPGTKNASLLLERLRRREKGLRLHFQDGSGDEIDLPINMSIGLASTETYPPESILKTADELMYENKRQFYQYIKFKKSS